MKKIPKVSIIVPMYNASDYIEKCAKSVLDQTFYDLEIIFVDDCSSDSTIQVLKKTISMFPERDGQVNILNHRINKGVSAARNTGLEIASGEYFIQIDSDDWVERNMVSDMYEKAKNEDSDIVWTDFYVEYPNKSNLKKYREQKITSKSSDSIKGILAGDLHSGLWNKLIRRRICVERNIRFPEEIKTCEDTVFITLFLTFAQRISYIPNAYYHYFQNPVSLTIKRNRQTYESEFEVVRILEKNLDNEIYLENLLIYKGRIKRNMLFSGLFSKSEYLKCFPESIPFIYIGLKSKLNKVAIWFSLKECFLITKMFLFFGQLYFKIKNVNIAYK